MTQSPIFRHSIETFEHALEHYLEGSPRSCKFALLHVDQSVELLLKERIVQIGKSIYKSDGTTLNFHEALSALKNRPLPEAPRLQELHELRNAIQHKGLSPDLDSTDFYMQVAYVFIKRFLAEEFAVPVDQVIAPQYRALIEGRSIPELAQILRTIESSSDAETPSDKIIVLHTGLMRLVGFLAGPGPREGGARTILRAAVEKHGADPSPLREYLDAIMRSRNLVVSGDYVATEGDAEAARFALREILKLVGLGRI